MGVVFRKKVRFDEKGKGIDVFLFDKIRERLDNKTLTFNETRRFDICSCKHKRDTPEARKQLDPKISAGKIHSKNVF